MRHAHYICMWVQMLHPVCGDQRAAFGGGSLPLLLHAESPGQS